ncbi:MAG: hypothetical protein Q8L21_01870 [Candidatus Komeilibacteria bacterium]|nr:hypothetical protein [Candidatus Komeilibacteria bacterium]
MNRPNNTKSGQYSDTKPLAEASDYARRVIDRAGDTILILAPGTSPSVFDTAARAVKKALLRGIKVTVILPASASGSGKHPLYSLIGQHGFLLFHSAVTPNRTVILIDAKTIYVDETTTLTPEDHDLSFTLVVNDVW